VFYNLALSCTDPETGERDPEEDSLYWLVGLSLDSGQAVITQRMPLLLPFHPMGPFSQPGEGITLALDGATGDIYLLGPVAILPLPSSPKPQPQEGPLMLLQQLSRGAPDDGPSRLSARNVSSALSASTVIGVDATFGEHDRL